MTDINNEWAAKAAYEAAFDRADRFKWEETSVQERLHWSKIAAAVTGASPAPFVVQCSIKVPGQSPVGFDTSIRLTGGSSDQDIDALCARLEGYMKTLRDE